MRTALACLAVVSCLAVSAKAQNPILPDEFGKYRKVEAVPVNPLESPAIGAEYGFVGADQAQYIGSPRFFLSAWRWKDSTGALAFYQWQRSQPGHWVQVGNYVLRFDSYNPKQSVLNQLTAKLPGFRRDPLPVLPAYLPEKDRIDQSERYLLGSASLQQFEPRIPAATALFNLGAEGQTAHYRLASGEVGLTIFSYPTPQIARQQVKAFETIPGAVARRTGPMIVVAFGEGEDVAKLVNSVQYQPSMMWTEATKDYSGNPGDMLIAIFQMIGYILVFCVGAGLLFALMRMVTDGTFGKGHAREPMITLHLQDK